MAKTSSLQPISRILGKILPAYGLKTHLAEWSLKVKWLEIVGEQVAAHSRPIRLNFKHLLVMVDNPAWVQHLTFLKPELMEKLQRSMGKETITEIRFKVGSLSENSLLPAALPRPLRTHLDEEETALVEEYLRPLQDPCVKERMRSLIMRSFLDSEKRLG
jgi:predicted nucleic acid-binding Zn ribbon protein